MRSILADALFITGIALIPYAIAVFMPTWRWLVGVAVYFGGLLTAIWIEHWIVTSSTDYRGSPGDFLGLGFFIFVTAGFAAGVFIRALTLVLASGGLPLRHVFTICVVGLTIVPAIFVSRTLWRMW